MLIMIAKKTNFIPIIALIAFVITSCNFNKLEQSSQKYSNIITKYTQIHQIVSKEVNDTFYVLIRLPKHYNENSNKRYPVLYLLDGDIAFNMATSIVRYLQFGKDIPDMIIVAPAYGTLLNDHETNYRERDYTFSSVEQFPNSGHGNAYLKFIETELIPFIDGNFRTDEKRILNGYSLGGLFVINSLIKKPDLFSDYIAGSPYLKNDIEKLLKSLKKHKPRNPKKIFISVGETEEIEIYRKPILKLVNNLKENKDVKIKFEIFKNGTHLTCPPEALVYGLKYIFN